MIKWNLLILISYIIIIKYLLISGKNLQNSNILEFPSFFKSSNVDCPPNCKDGKCDNTTLRCDSCIEGYYKDDCSQNCPTKNCKICAQDDGICNQCLDPYSLIDNYCCEEICEKCNNDGCTECKDKTKYSSKCEDCPSNCYYDEQNRKCEQNTGNCFSCISGKTGIKCEQNCNEGCDLTKKNCDMNDGKCICKQGFYGETCENKCDEKCTNCDSINGTCYKCQDHFYPKDKNCFQCPENCDGECPEGKCLKCKSGFYGEICDKNCSQYCVNKICNKEDGYCDCINHFSEKSHCTECENKYDIKTECVKCLGNYDINTDCINCINHYNESTSCEECDKHFTIESKCNQCEENYNLDTNCTTCINYFDLNTNCKECLIGHYGEKCDKNCYEGCNTSKENCRREDGYCKECYNPYYGEKCENKSEVNHCINVNKTSGECLECEQTYYLTEQKTCESCSPNCKDSLCSGPNGRCNDCASFNSFGEKCEFNCSRFCSQTITQPICSRNDGICTFGCAFGNFSDGQCTICTPGFYPQDEGCTKTCSSHCKDICNATDGFCSECTGRYFGDKCDEECNELCDESCEKKSGKCIDCVIGYYKDDSTPEGCSKCPELCTQCEGKEKCTSCITGKYGEKCDLDCSPNCKDNQCDFQGNCKCKVYFYGEHCDFNCSGCAENGCLDENGACIDHYCSGKFFDPRMCNKPCGDNCDGEGKCDLFTGECISCKGNKWGINCMNDCLEECEIDGRVDCCYAKHQKSQRGININIIEKEKNINNLGEEQNEFDLISINLGGFDLTILADFETNSPLVIFDLINTNPKGEGSEIYNISVNLKYNSSNSSNFIKGESFNRFYEYDGFTLINELTAKDKLIINNITFNNFSFLICQGYKIEKDFGSAGKINGIVGLGLRNYFTENLFWDNNAIKLPKNILVKSLGEKKSIYIGDYSDEIKKGFSKLSTMEIRNKEHIIMNKLISFETGFTGIAYSLRKAYQYQYDKNVILNNRIETNLILNNLYKQFFEKIYFGDLFENGCYFRSLQGGEGEYYCDISKRSSIQTLPKLGLIIGDYIYYLSYQFLYKESGQFITFNIKLHGQSQQRIELGKSFFDEFSVVYNNGNETLNFYGDIKKLNVPLRDPSNLLNIDSDIFTPGGWVTLIVFITAMFIIFCYFSKYCINKEKEEESDDDEDDDMGEEDEGALIDDTLE